MLRCKEVSHLLSESQDRQLKLLERLQLNAHLFMCAACTRYRQQLNFIRRACRDLADGKGGSKE